MVDGLAIDDPSHRTVAVGEFWGGLPVSSVTGTGSVFAGRPWAESAAEMTYRGSGREYDREHGGAWRLLHRRQPEPSSVRRRGQDTPWRAPCEAVLADLS